MSVGPHRLRPLAAALVALAAPVAKGADLHGTALAWPWALPFVAWLLAIALLPLLRPLLWHHHYGKLSALAAASFLLPFAALHGLGAAGGVVWHALVAEYLPFIVLLVALYTVSGGIYLRGNLHGSPALNTGLLAIGALLGSLMGTTGAAMLMVRPVLRANDNRRHNAHVMVFFIFIVANAGGSLSPLGDPPLFLGFLQGVSFGWPLAHLWPLTLFLVGSLLAVFYVLDRYWYRREGILPADPTPNDTRLGLEGAVNLLPLLMVVALVLLSGVWVTEAGWHIGGVFIGLPDVVRDVGLLGVTALSLALTPRGVRERNAFTWAPMQEVAKLFAGIFLTMAPVLAMLKAGEAGALSAITHAVTGPDGQPVPAAYFWLSGVLSSFLDNAPTYLVFFNLAGGDATTLMGPLASTLLALSAGSVFMGANSYIGNAPNFMVKAVAEERGVKMPSFFGYMAWSCVVLLPLFAVMTGIWFL